MIAFLVAIIFVAADRVGDLDFLQGTWSLVRSVTDSKTQSVVEAGQLVVDKDHFIEKTTTTIDGTLKLNSYNNLNTFDQTIEVQSREKTVVRGIFQVGGDTFRQCSILGSDTKVPEDFSSIEGGRRTLQVWKREGRAYDNPKAEKGSGAYTQRAVKVSVTD